MAYFTLWSCLSVLKAFPELLFIESLTSVSEERQEYTHHDRQGH